MRYILATTLLMTVAYVSPASAGCGPAVQNWTNGSKTTCTYDSNGGAFNTVAAVGSAPVQTVPTPPPPVEEKCKKDGYGDYGGYGRSGKYGKKSS